MYKTFLGTLFVAVLSSKTVNANDNVMSEVLAKQLSQSMEVSLKAMNDPKLIKAKAKYIRSLYDALIEEGFTKEQAIQLVSAILSSKK